MRSILRVCLLMFAMLCANCALANEAAIVLWPNGAPGSEGKTGDEIVRLTELGEHIVSNVHRPSITPYIPSPEKATGAAVIVIPGGGHRELWMDHEGYRVAQWLSDHGIAAFVLKYRLAKQEGSTYTVEGNSLADVQRAIRVVRSRAAEWHIARNRIGVIGFSAGGELAALAGTRPGIDDASDAIGHESARPDFLGLIYPAIPPGLTVSRDTPPAFLLCGADDSPAIADALPQLYLAFRHAGAPAELHILTGTGHGFGIRDSNPPAVAAWPTLFHDWLGASGFLKPLTETH